MIVLVHKAVPQLLPFRGRPIGRLISPRGGFGAQATVDAGLLWACDNDAFSGFDEPRYRRMLDAVAGIPDCLFVTLPDVVEDAAATLELAGLWLPELEARGLPPALVSQDGLAAADVPWPRLRALFVGGSTGWKYAEESVAVVREAKRRGLWVHFGRVNTMRRATWARALGADSFDGTNFSMFTDTKLPRMLDHLEQPAQTTMLKEGAA